MLILVLAALFASQFELGDGYNVAPRDTTTKRVIMGYLSYWGGLDVRKINGDYFTHLVYAFANIDIATGNVIPGTPDDINKITAIVDDCACCAKGNYNLLFQLRKEYPHLRILLSIGGYSWSGLFAPVIGDSGKRTNFINSAIKLVVQYGFDGIDVDWEYPQNQNEGTLFVGLMRDLRAKLTAQPNGANYQLTAAIPVAPSTLANYKLSQIQPYMTYLMVMTYDVSIGSGYATHHAPLYHNPADPNADFSVDATVKFLLKNSILASQIVVGIPLYGHSYPVLTNDVKMNGLFRKVNCVSGSCDGWITYNQILNDLKNPQNVRYFDAVSKAPYIYNQQTGTFVTYEDNVSVRYKIDYVEAMNLGGMMQWEIVQDPMDSNPTKSIVRVMATELNNVDFYNYAPWCSQNSNFCNVKCLTKTMFSQRRQGIQ